MDATDVGHVEVPPQYAINTAIVDDDDDDDQDMMNRHDREN